jgi:paraquat-inducible protein B
VTEIGLELNTAKALMRPRVTITFHPERLISYVDAAAKDDLTDALKNDDKRRRAFLQRLVEERGLRAQLKSGSLITGQLYVAFDYYPKAPKAKVVWKGEIAELPVVAGGLADLEAKLTSILEKIDKMPLEAIATSLQKDLEGLDVTLADASKLMKNIDAELVPTLKGSLEGLQRAVTGFERTLANLDKTLLSPDAPMQQELRDAMTEFTRAARSVRVLIDYLERHPESAIRGKSETTSGGK